MLTLILILGLMAAPAWGVSLGDVTEFLSQTPPPVKGKIIQAINENPRNSLFTAEHAEKVYSLCIIPVRKSQYINMQKSLNMAAINQASLKAALNLAKFLDNHKTPAKNFPDSDTVGRVLLEHYEGRVRFSSSAKIIGDNAFALVWSGKANFPMNESELNMKYNESLYGRGQEYFSAGKYPEALRSFKGIRFREWKNVEAYLGAGVCILEMGSNDYAGQLVSEAVNLMSADMTADDLALSGRLLFEAGRKDEGFDVLERAYNSRR